MKHLGKGCGKTTLMTLKNEKAEGSQLTTICSQLKIQSADGKFMMSLRRGSTDRKKHQQNAAKNINYNKNLRIINRLTNNCEKNIIVNNLSKRRGKLNIINRNKND